MNITGADIYISVFIIFIGVGFDLIGFYLECNIT